MVVFAEKGEGRNDDGTVGGRGAREGRDRAPLEEESDVEAGSNVSNCTLLVRGG